MEVTRSDDGIVYTIHQSDLATYQTCPERARRLWTGEVADFTTEAAAKGTAVHTAAEAVLLGGSAATATALARAVEVFDTLAAGDTFRWVKTKGRDTCLRHIETAFNAWLDHVYPTLGSPLLVERKFDLLLDRGEVGGDPDHPVFYPPTKVELRLAGQIDYGDELGLDDWKVTTHDYMYTGGFGGDGWKLQRWGIQATTYTWAVHQLGIYPSPVDFTWVAINPVTGRVTYLACSRDESDWEWLKKLCWNVVRQWEADLGEWPLNDQHALCSEQWCPAHSVCKGAVRKTAGDAEVTSNYLGSRC